MCFTETGKDNRECNITWYGPRQFVDGSRQNVANCKIAHD